jgi:hypothetical protein
MRRVLSRETHGRGRRDEAEGEGAGRGAGGGGGGTYGKHGCSVAMQPWQFNGDSELLTCAFMAAHLLADINRASQVVVSLRVTRQINGIPFHAARCTRCTPS